MALAMLRTESLFVDSTASGLSLEPVSAPRLLLESGGSLFTARVLRPWWWPSLNAKFQ